MPKLYLVIVVTACLASLAFGAETDAPGPDWISQEQVTQKLQQSGYSEVTELKADDGHWEGKGVKSGQEMEFDADAHTGAIISEKPDREDVADKDWISLEQLAQKLRESGYDRITKLEAEKGRWEGKGIKNGQHVNFHADAHSGAILSDKVVSEDKDKEDKHH
jgi:uncharacterized membrane protein YkoI